MTAPANYKQLIAIYNLKSEDIRNYFIDFPELVERYDWNIPISYVFSRIETAKHTTLYCGLVKRHWTNAELTKEMLDKDHLSRSRFRELFARIFDKPIEKNILEKLSAAESVRDRVAHGKTLTQVQARDGLAQALEFAEEFSAFVSGMAGFRPFGDLRGFKGRAESLTKETTRWVLRGMDIPPRVKANIE